MDSETTTQVKTPPSRHYFYRKATQQQPISPHVVLDGLESAHAFENRIDHFISKNALQSSIVKLRQEATADLNRRKADRKARKEKENNNIIEPTPPTPPIHDVLFEKLSSLTHNEQNAWLSNIHDDAMLMNPHQWLKLASLFNVNSKASRQQSLLQVESLECVLKDRGIESKDVGPLESFLELRDIQNRNYARDAVAEGVKFIKQNRVKEAMEFYKRALDMDPKYADGWFHVAEGLVQQRKLSDAELHLDRVLKLDPTHEGAKALLASIRHTKNPKKSEKGEEWDIVDENGQALNATPPEQDEKDKLKSILKKRRQEDEKKRSSRRHESSSRYKKSSRRSSASPRRRRSPSPRSRHHRDDKNSRDRRSHRDSDRRSRRSERSTRDYDNDRRRERGSDRRNRDRDDDRRKRSDDRKSRDYDDDSKSRDRNEDKRSRDRQDDKRSRDHQDDRKSRDYQNDRRNRTYESDKKCNTYEDNRDTENDRKNRDTEDDRRDKDRSDNRKRKHLGADDDDKSNRDRKRRYHDDDKKNKEDTDKPNDEHVKKDITVSHGTNTLNEINEFKDTSVESTSKRSISPLLKEESCSKR